MGAILQQLGIDDSFYIQFGVIFITFAFLRFTYFSPFLKLIQTRAEKTTQAKKEAERLALQSKQGSEQYRSMLHAEQLSMRQQVSSALAEAKQKEAQLMADAKEQARKITQETFEEIEKQRIEIRRALDVEVESMAHKISETLMGRKS